ncbi:MAG: amidohydrolase family protein [Gemmatimonadota bacterium]
MRLIAGVVLALSSPLAAQAPVTIYASRLLDGKGGQQKDVTVTVDGPRILRVERGRPEKPPTFDYTGYTIMPGLIDVHTHVTGYINRKGRLHTPDDGDTPAEAALSAAAGAYATLMAGFTTIQSIGSIDDKDLRDWIDRGDIPGPRMLTSLEPITDASLTPDQLRAQVRSRVEQGADVIKLFASKSIRDGGTQTLSEEQLRAACGEAKKLGRRTVVHAHSAESMRAAVLAGCSQIEHGIFSTPEVLKLMADRGTYFGPQCALIFRNYLDNRPKFEGIGNYNAAGFAAMEKAIPLAIGVVRQSASVPNLKLVYGTDAVAGAHGKNAEDLVCRVQQAGHKAMDVLVSATSVNATSLEIADRVGSIAPAMQADLIAVKGNPLDDITTMRRTVFVMKAGKVFRADK